jgi:hypothetical protein
MNRRINLLMVCGVLLLGSVWTSSASAQFGGGYGLGFYNYGGGAYGGGYGNLGHIPFYALHPPVYYSYPVARPYGYSPFAYPPGVMTPELKPNVGAAGYGNPFIPKRDDPQPSADRQASMGPIIINPFVQQARAASAAVAQTTGQ